jgi:RHH-type proline utilization regulon transcriptional repressor/proline dehydrogenase/delta 1-pyrroline-5-carboxylate dehydrogenase
MAATGDIERRTRQIGAELLHTARAHRLGLFSSRFWSGQLMDWAMKDPVFKIQLFRFIDAFPTLNTPTEVHQCLLDYLSQPGVTLPPWMAAGLKTGRLAAGALSRTIGNRIAALAGNFIAGEDVASALPVLQKLWKQGIAFSVDLLGEACVSRNEALAYQTRYLELIETLPANVAAWAPNPPLESDHLGPVPRANVSIKISSLDARTDPIDLEGSLQRLTEMLRPILLAAARHNVLVNFDMEQHALKDLTLELFQRCAVSIDFPVGLAIQSYLTSGEEDARRIIAWSQKTGRQVTVRLIKGAYWDYEVIHAEQTGWPVPVWTAKHETDACFERMAELFVASTPKNADAGGVKLALGSHNVRSIAHTLSLLEKYGLPESAVELQMLFGMGDQLKAAVLKRGLRLREYVPLGQMIPGMAYLVRRLLENTSNQSWLRASFSDDVPDDLLLESPHEKAGTGPAYKPEGWLGTNEVSPQDPQARKPEGWLGTNEVSPQRSRDRENRSLATLYPSHPASSDMPPGSPPATRHGLSPAVQELDDGSPFLNEPLRDFSRKETRDRFAAAVASAKPPEVAAPATAEDAERAVRRADDAFGSWRDTDPVDRSTFLVRAAAIMQDRRDELSGMIIREAGKPWREADADVCEAIDFCRYYARSALRLFRPRRLGRFLGELNQTWYQPRGIAVVISPWNFPLAITTGMTAAALATGNTAIVKPSSQTPGIARAMADLLYEAGVPPDVLQLVIGPGESVGSALVADPRVAIIAFTGSKQVGLQIIEAAGRTPAGQSLVKKVVCEMGGKNAVIVDSSADLDQAVAGVRQSAFGYSGQKCSACSRAIVLDAVHDVFLRRLVESTRSLVIGDPADPGTDLGPVIDQSAARKIRDYIALGNRENRLELACDVPPGLEDRVGKPYIGPHIFSHVHPEHRLANEEIFGPVLSVMRAQTFQQAIDLANATAYKLTGGVYSRRPSHLEIARRQFRVGNLYLNRAITGALVGRQPFGGFGLSGTGTKAGGRDYLLNFVQPRDCTENTLRHGFAPGLD